MTHFRRPMTMRLPGKSNRLGSVLLTGTGVLAGAVLAARLKKPSSQSISGKVVLITGGSRGLGLALAQEFGKAGARLVLAARDIVELQSARTLLRARGAAAENDVLLAPCDLTDPANILQLISDATAAFGRIDILINNAGLIHVGPVQNQPIEAFRESMETGYFAMVQTSLAVLPQMLQRKAGSIVNIASIGGKVGVPHLAPYSGTKFAAVGFSETLHSELRSKGVRVTTVCPGLMRTGSFPNAIVVGDLEKEYRWFSIASATPGLSHSAEGAARKILRAVSTGRSEITIGADAWLAARFAGIAPETTQFLAHLAQSAFLPESTGGVSIPAEARHIRPPKIVSRLFSDTLSKANNEPRP